MSELLSAAAAALGIPETLVQRSAEARAAETGGSVDDFLSAWAGGEPVAPAASPAGSESEVAEPEVAEPAAATEEPPETAHLPEPVLTEATDAVTTRAPVPAEVTPAEAAHLPDVVTVATAGIRERTNFTIPRWLTSLLIVVPLFALFALGGSATGECGEATELMTDVVSGEIVNCDGSPFTGQAVAGGRTDYLALGQSIYDGSGIAGITCAGCHGVGGQGVASFPALTGVLTTFGACTDHIEWVTLGSAGFAGETYGDTGKMVAGGMPSFASSLTAEQIAAVAVFERVRFGGGDPDSALAGCGLAEVPTEDGEATTDGGESAETRSRRS